MHAIKMFRPAQRPRIEVEEARTHLLNFIRVGGRDVFLTNILANLKLIDIYYLYLSDDQIYDYFDQNGVWNALLQRHPQYQNQNIRDTLRNRRMDNPLWVLLSLEVYRIVIHEQESCRFINDIRQADHVTIEKEYRRAVPKIVYKFHGHYMVTEIYEEWARRGIPGARQQRNYRELAIDEGYALNLPRIYQLFILGLGLETLGDDRMRANIPIRQCIECGNDAQHMCAACEAPYCGRDCQMANWSIHQRICNN
jgi:hypothetical protein